VLLEKHRVITHILILRTFIFSTLNLFVGKLHCFQLQQVSHYEKDDITSTSTVPIFYRLGLCAAPGSIGGTFQQRVRSDGASRNQPGDASCDPNHNYSHGYFSTDIADSNHDDNNDHTNDYHYYNNDDDDNDHPSASVFILSVHLSLQTILVFMH
jgi:hypothetical protein